MSALAIGLIFNVAAAQQPVTRLVGRVVDNRTNEAVAGATVRLGAMTATTDVRGWFALEAPAVERAELRIASIGYAARTDSVGLELNRTNEVIVRLTAQPIELPAISVTVRSAWLERNGVYERMHHSGLSGHWITRADIEKRNPTFLTDLLRDVPGAKMHRHPEGQFGLAGRQIVRFSRMEGSGLRASGLPKVMELPGCQPLLYLDGRRHYDRVERGYQIIDDFNVVNPVALEAVEIYVGGNAPIEFRNESCGVILLWTRRGG